MAINLQADPTLPRGYIQINGTTAATVTSTGIGPATSLVSGVVASSLGYTPANQSAQIGSGTIGSNLFGSSRASGTTYTNTTGRPLVVYIIASNTPSNGSVTVSIGGVNAISFNCYGNIGGGCFIVPIGSTYSCTASGSTITSWIEY